MQETTHIVLLYKWGYLRAPKTYFSIFMVLIWSPILFQDTYGFSLEHPYRFKIFIWLHEITHIVSGYLRVYNRSPYRITILNGEQKATHFRMLIRINELSHIDLLYPRADMRAPKSFHDAHWCTWGSISLFDNLWCTLDYPCRFIILISVQENTHNVSWVLLNSPMSFDDI